MYFYGRSLIMVKEYYEYYDKERKHIKTIYRMNNNNQRDGYTDFYRENGKLLMREFYNAGKQQFFEVYDGKTGLLMERFPYQDTKESRKPSSNQPKAENKNTLKQNLKNFIKDGTKLTDDLVLYTIIGTLKTSGFLLKTGLFTSGVVGAYTSLAIENMTKGIYKHNSRKAGEDMGKALGTVSKLENSLIYKTKKMFGR